MYRIKVQSVLSNNVDNRLKIEEIITEDRKVMIEAAVVRVMKARNRLQHNNLVSEVISLLSSRFTPPVNFIKKRIEALIEREFLERDKSDRRVYVYLA